MEQKKYIPPSEYDCSCQMEYPNTNLKKHNGEWKCAMCYVLQGKTKSGKTCCKKVRQKGAVNEIKSKTMERNARIDTS